jgi:hypothetical protein
MLTLARSDLPTKLSPQVVEQPEPTGLPRLPDWLNPGLLARRRSSPDDTADRQDVTQNEKGPDKPDQGLQAETAPPHRKQETPDKVRTGASTSADQLIEEPNEDDSEPRYLRRRFSDVRGDQDILEV